MTVQTAARPADPQGRRIVMALVARASADVLQTGLTALDPQPAHAELRRPEVGLVMLRGRIAGTGAPFNIGEATVTRAAVRLETGEMGFSCVLGRDAAKARVAALIDALWQRETVRPLLESSVLGPLRVALAAGDAKAARETAGTRVDFFTLVRGEDE
jgi:alpha-D-ribose 1-methylphosphonate 5-triphosphate synthase subunit PhnG